MAKKLKYKINEKVDSLPKYVTSEILLRELLNHGISRDSFYRDRKIEAGSNQSIPSDRLDAYAVVFGCTIEELKNYTITGKSIHEVMAQPKKLKTSLK